VISWADELCLCGADDCARCWGPAARRYLASLCKTCRGEGCEEHEATEDERDSDIEDLYRNEGD
jgi:predicted nucleic acid binding AN1-type Zn finger protein